MRWMTPSASIRRSCWMSIFWEIAGIARSRSEKAQDLAAKQVEQDDQLPAAFEDFECVLNALGGRNGCQLFRLTFWCVPYFFVRSCHFVRLAPCWSHCKTKT